MFLPTRGRNTLAGPAAPAPVGTSRERKGPPCTSETCRAGHDWKRTARYRLSWMTSASMVSTVVMTLLLAWKPRWVRIMSTISAAMSTFEVSRE